MSVVDELRATTEEMANIAQVPMELWNRHRLSPETVMVSSTPPTRMSALTVAVKAVVRTIPSRRTVLNPGKVKVTL
jgi:hypothetical protein